MQRRQTDRHREKKRHTHTHTHTHTHKTTLENSVPKGTFGGIGCLTEEELTEKRAES